MLIIGWILIVLFVVLGVIGAVQPVYLILASCGVSYLLLPGVPGWVVALAWFVLYPAIALIWGGIEHWRSGADPKPKHAK